LTVPWNGGRKGERDISHGREQSPSLIEGVAVGSEVSMRWMFFFLLFDTTGGDLRPMTRLTAVFGSESACNEAGARIMRDLRYQDNSLRSFSICIPESAFDARGVQTEDLRR
jgi:hypothetical protein